MPRIITNEEIKEACRNGMAPGLTYAQVKALRPCEHNFAEVTKRIGGPRKWNGRAVTAAQARDAGVTFAKILWAAAAVARTNPDVERRLRLWMADCAARVLHIYEKWAPGDARVRTAIMVARKFARGEAPDAARGAAGNAASGAAWAAARAYQNPFWDAARASALSSAWSSAWVAAVDAPWGAPREAAWAAYRAAGERAAWAAGGARSAEEQWQFDRLVLWLSDEEPDDLALPDPTTGTKREAA